MKDPVLIVGNFLSGSGLARGVCEDLADRLGKAGWPVLTTSSRPGRLARVVDMASTVWSKRRDYALAQVDVYGGLAFGWAELACWELRRLGKPYCLTLHGGSLPAFAQLWPGRLRSLLRSARIVTSPSGYLRDALKSFREDIRLLPNPLEIDRYPFRLRATPRPALVWLRGFHDIYNPTLAPRVVALLAEEFPEVSIRMIGPDKCDGSLGRTRAEAQRLGVASRIEFPGAVDKARVPAALADADIFLNTTNVDNAPVSVMEAMACGLCVVSTSVGGVPYLVEDGRNGLLVPAGDAEAMAAAVRRVLREPGLAGRISENGRRDAQGSDWSIVLPVWEAILGSLVRERGPVSS